MSNVVGSGGDWNNYWGVHSFMLLYWSVEFIFSLFTLSGQKEGCWKGWIGVGGDENVDDWCNDGCDGVNGNKGDGGSGQGYEGEDICGDVIVLLQ